MNKHINLFTERNAIFSRLEETASRLNMNEDERVQYNDELKKYRDYFNQIDFAKDSGLREGREQGRKEGREEGIKQGIEQGIKQGIKQGMEKGREQGESNKQLEIAASMKADGMSIALIQKYTGLTAEAIQNI